ncbi:MAG: helicase [Candidatus Harrisonbacteria bacterium]|nr:helicase [Candidatus Harrisonbacteria bacterium]
MKDVIVFDIETKNTFADVGGAHNIDRLETSFVGVYSYQQDKYLSFFEEDFPQLGPIFQNAGMVIGFATKRFDLPVMRKYFNFNIMALNNLDLLEVIEAAYGSRIGLDILAQTNLGVGKTGHGLDAIRYWEEGKLKELQEYCLQDVKVTKMLYDFIKKNGYVAIPKKYTNEIVRVPLVLPSFEVKASLF